MGDSIIYVIRISPLLLTERARQAQTSVPPVKQCSNDRRSPPEQSPLTSLPRRSAWLFQSNPTLYDLRGALVSLREQVWSVSRYAKEIRVGDRVYLWEAGRQGGIAGVAEITEPPRVQPEPSEQHPFARVSQVFAGERPRARLGILSVIEPVIPRQSIIARTFDRLGIIFHKGVPVKRRDFGFFRRTRRLSLSIHNPLDGGEDALTHTLVEGTDVQLDYSFIRDHILLGSGLERAHCDHSCLIRS